MGRLTGLLGVVVLIIVAAGWWVWSNFVFGVISSGNAELWGSFIIGVIIIIITFGLLVSGTIIGIVLGLLLIIVD